MNEILALIVSGILGTIITLIIGFFVDSHYEYKSFKTSLHIKGLDINKQGNIVPLVVEHTINR
ncbi:hypothetical protein [Clostridium beijerinckii]|uniref:hypothetical protein n=1 Tax=Clostridium beijerinckii TaxID=1520 RepID=UPI0004789C1F|nr:hypothetical protein [Clostridium beijerinckii]